MKISTDCQKVMSLRNEYFQNRSSAALVESHLAECPGCLDFFIDMALIAPPSTVRAETLAIYFNNNLDGIKRRSARRSGIVIISTIVGVATACVASQVLADIPTPLHSVIASGEILLVGVILIEFGALFLLPAIVRTDQ